VLFQRAAELVRGRFALPGAHERRPLLQEIGARHHHPSRGVGRRRTLGNQDRGGHDQAEQSHMDGWFLE
jgi:hypothetical protein